MSDTAGGPPRLKGRSYAETRSAVLDMIRTEGEISRADLARRSALTEKTISGIVRSLIESGLVVEAGYAQSTGGKRPVLLRLNDKELYAVGISLYVARCVLVICGLDGTEIARSELRGSGTQEPAAVIKRISAAVTRLLHRQHIAKESVIGVCLARGGRRTIPATKPEASFADVWERFAAEAELAQATGLTVIGENDAKCAALGEFWTAGNSTRDFAVLYLAEGIGCGIIIGGAIYRGSSGNSGEIGHIQTDPEGVVCWCGRRGCLDTVASPRAITERIEGDPRLSELCGLTPQHTFGETFRQFAEQVKGGVPELVKVFDLAAGQLADAMIDLVNTFDFDLISLTGPSLVELGEQYRAAIELRVAELALSRDVHPVEVRLGGGGADAAALGAASVVLHRNLTPHHSTV